MIECKTGLTFRVQIEENPTTGYEWQYVPQDGIKLENKEYRPSRLDNRPMRPGDGGECIFTLKGEVSGEFKVNFILKRSWVPVAIETKEIQVRVI